MTNKIKTAKSIFSLLIAILLIATTISSALAGDSLSNTLDLTTYWADESQDTITVDAGEEPEYVIRGIVDSGSTTQIYWIGFDTEIPAKVQAAGARRLSAEDQPSLDRAFDEVFEEVMAEAPEIPHQAAPKEK